MNAYELQSGEKMADTVKRGVLLKGLAHLLEVQKHVKKDSARLNSHAELRSEVVGLLRVEAALHMPMDVDWSTDWLEGKGQGKRKLQARWSERQGQSQGQKKEK